MASSSESWLRFGNSVYSKPLRPIVLFTSSISLSTFHFIWFLFCHPLADVVLVEHPLSPSVWSLVLGVRFFQDRSEGIETPRMATYGLSWVYFYLLATLKLSHEISQTYTFLFPIPQFSISHLLINYLQSLVFSSSSSPESNFLEWLPSSLKRLVRFAIFILNHCATAITLFFVYICLRSTFRSSWHEFTSFSRVLPHWSLL